MAQHVRLLFQTILQKSFLRFAFVHATNDTWQKWFIRKNKNKRTFKRFVQRIFLTFDRFLLFPLLLSQPFPILRTNRCICFVSLHLPFHKIVRFVHLDLMAGDIVAILRATVVLGNWKRIKFTALPLLPPFDTARKVCH